MTNANRKTVSQAYFAKCIVQDGLANGKSIGMIRGELQYVCEYSEVLGQRDVETIIEIGTGQRVA